MNAYEITAVVHDARIEVDPALEGQLVRVIIFAPGADVPAEQASKRTPLRERFGTVVIPGKIEFLTRDEAHAR